MQFGLVTKAVGGLSAIIALGFAIAQVYSSITGYFEHRKSITDFENIADRELAEHEYNAAWNGNAAAVQIAPTDARGQDQQAQIAMRWLDDLRLSSKPGAKNFSDIVVPLEDALTRRAESVDGQKLATIEAHIGWARFLRSRDGVTGLQIVEKFDEALALDSSNMYAHVMRGFVLLKNSQNIEATRKDFDAALSSSTDADYCDDMIMAAFFNSTADPMELAAAEYANKIRILRRELTSDSKRRLLWIYSQGMHDEEFLAHLAAAMSAADHIATLDWLVQEDTQQQSQDEGKALKAYFFESSGDKTNALKLYQSVVAELPANSEVKSFAQTRMSKLDKVSNIR